MQLFILLGILFGVAQASCPNGWISNGTSCYLIPNAGMQYLNAKADCISRGAYLVNIESQVENEFLKKMLHDRQSGNDFYIGLTDRRIEDTWLWDSTQQQAVFTDWAPGQPDVNGDQNCAVMFRTSKYQWHDVNCAEYDHYICERQSADGNIVG